MQNIKQKRKSDEMENILHQQMHNVKNFQEFVEEEKERQMGYAPMELETFSTFSGGGENKLDHSVILGEFPFTCLYMNGRMLERDEIIKVLKQKNLWEPEMKKAQDNQLCVFLNDNL